MEYFEDLRNVNHCEFITMERSETTGKYILQAQLRTWSAYKKEQEAKRLAPGTDIEVTAVKDSASLSYGKEEHALKAPRRWGGCVNGCNHAKFKWYTYGEPNTNNVNGDNYGKADSQGDGANEAAQHTQNCQERLRERLEVLGAGRDFGGSKSGAGRDVEDDTGSGSGGEDDLLEQVKRKLADLPIGIDGHLTHAPRGMNGAADASSLESPMLPTPPNTAVPKIEVCETISERLGAKQLI